MQAPDPDEQIDALARMLCRGLERPAALSDWKRATYPSTGTVHLFLDGWMSVGDDNFHLSSVYLERVNEFMAPHLPEVAAFTYSSPGKTYHKIHTTESPLNKHVQNLLQIFGESPQVKWVITAYSLGAVVTAVALGRLAQSEANLRERVPMVIFWSPPFQGAPALARVLDAEDQDEEEGESEEGELLEDQPAENIIHGIAIDLVRPNSTRLMEARSALPILIEAGVAVEVIHSPYDRLAPLDPPFANRRLFRFETPSSLLPLEKTNSYDVHVRMRNLGENHRHVCGLTRSLAPRTAPK